MAKKNSQKLNTGSQTAAKTTTNNASSAKNWLAPLAMVVMLGAAAAIYFYGDTLFGKSNSSSNSEPDMGLKEPIKMNIAQAVMVTVDLDFGRPATIAEAIQQIERGYQPDDGAGRTFAVLDAYGEMTPEGKLHMSMHVSSEKPGTGWLKFKKTGETLWRGRFGNPGDAPAGPKSLTIYMDNGAGGNYVLDGSRNPASALDANLQNSTQKLRDVWPDGSDREFTFIYSACGCPVKAKVRRVGEKTQRASDLPVMFPDDPAVVQVISNLMKW
ncbi:MAG: hypothetical protein SF097_26735 [Acidobacteriota bacterium]|nr:hypothetical protein [Acidobacteriota bacterium]